MAYNFLIHVTLARLRAYLPNSFKYSFLHVWRTSKILINILVAAATYVELLDEIPSETGNTRAWLMIYLHNPGNTKSTYDIYMYSYII